MLKRKLAALLAGAMVLTSLPMVSFAKTGNNVDRVPVVKDDVTFNWENAPVLRIKKDPSSIGDQTFQLKFENADWKGYDEDDEYNEEEVQDTNLYNGVVGGYTYRKVTDKIVEIKVGADATNYTGDQFIEIPLVVEMGDAGDAKVTIDAMDSTISAGTYTFAVAGSGDTITTIEKAETITSGDTIKPIVIEESKIGVFGEDDQEIELRLPSNFKWSIDEAKVSLTGGLVDNATPAAPTVEIKDGSDGKIATVSVKFDDDRDARGAIVIAGLKITANNKAKYGDVTVKVSGTDVTSETITVANYVDYQVSIEADGDPKEIFAGRFDKENYDTLEGFDFDGDYELQKLVIEEDVINSWLTQRSTTISFPSWVQILGYKINNIDNMVVAGFADNKEVDCLGNADENEITFTSTSETSGKKKKLEITFFVSVEANATGDITATVSGRSLGDEFEVVLGEALAPVEVAVDVADVRIGRQTQELGDITIAETKEGAILEGRDLIVRLPEGFEWTNTPNVEVTEGDLEIDKKNIKVEDGNNDNGGDGNDTVLIIPIDTNSREASTIVISDVSVDLDRTIPEGTFELEVGGDAVVENDGDDDEFGEFRTDYVAEVEFANVVTPNPEDLSSGKASAQKATFTVGSADYTVGEEVATADAAPYIKDGRTMIPVKYAAYALGVDPSNIKWDQATKTATILGDRVIQVKIGSKDLVVNGAALTMDVAAEVVDGRTYLPISWVASALNVPYSWDDATKTVTFN